MNEIGKFENDEILKSTNNFKNQKLELKNNSLDITKINSIENIETNDQILKLNDISDKIKNNDNLDFSSQKLEQNNDEIKKNQMDFKKNTPISNGTWAGERGDSKWIPDNNYVPKKFNPNNENWRGILKPYNIDSINFVDGEPDFSEISKGTVEIDDFSKHRDDNYAQAYEKLAEQKGVNPSEVKKWMKENGYLWHERSDCKTMDKIPAKIHQNISHLGGHSIMLNK